MDDESQIQCIKSDIDKSFNEIDAVIGSLTIVLPLKEVQKLKAAAHMYFGGYLDACKDFGILSLEKCEELAQYCEDKTRGL